MASHLKLLADNASDLLLGGKKGDSCVLHEKETTESATEAANLSYCFHLLCLSHHNWDHALDCKSYCDLEYF